MYVGIYATYLKSHALQTVAQTCLDPSGFLSLLDGDIGVIET